MNSTTNPTAAIKHTEAGEHATIGTNDDREYICLYAIVPAGVYLGDWPGLDMDRPVFVCEVDGLAAIVSWVRETHFNQHALKENLQDIEWLSVHANLFQSVLNRLVATQQPLIPLRFCTIYASESDVQTILKTSGTSLQSELDRLRGKEEWGLKLRLDMEYLGQSILDGAPLLPEMPMAVTITALQERIKKVPAGSAFLLKKQLDQQIKQYIESLRVYYATQSHNRLKQYAVDFTTNTPDTNDRSLVLHAAYLVAHKEASLFLHEVELLTATYTGVGLQYELSGPWPAYNFLNADVID